MKIERAPFAFASALALAAVLAVGASGVSAQPPGGKPPAGFPSGPPPGAGAGGPPPGIAEGTSLAPPPPPPLTDAQKVLAALPPPMKAIAFPQPPVPADAPKSAADPRDFQGVWYHDQALEVRISKDMYGQELPVTMAGAEVIKRRVMSAEAGKPFVNASAKCLPPGPQWQRDLNFPFQIVQGKTWMEFIFEEYHGRWNIAIDPQTAPVPASKEYMGRSNAHWEGNTLVVESSDFKQALWLDVDGTPLSSGGKLIQRIRKVDLGDGSPFLEIITTIDDPKYYTNPWNVVRRFAWHPNLAKFKEYNCEEQVGDPSGITDSGLVPEPAE
ncbi:hypothetical protein WSK_1993 [Novosphingobium sp. Rr 2-17]|uniref:hypothetical protein n=1 Tax=Novosphingobium sp. Rr 2-17 TaxID=555793 RepID=UPI0002698506|nr:hypothetical protein [Novosphingobium sp. Rr 2-17]EIZ79429.1 hypothetical protein WSK_1993 [Novosphingobium sp. Rr 2-17]